MAKLTKTAEKNKAADGESGGKNRALIDVSALLLIGAGIFFIYCIAVPSASGNLGGRLGDALNTAMGFASITIPVILIIAGVHLVYPFSGKTLFYYPFLTVTAFWSAEILRCVIAGSGSVWGMAAAAFMIGAMGKAGTFLLILLVGVIAVVLFSGVKLDDAARRLTELAETHLEKRKLLAQARKEEALRRRESGEEAARQALKEKTDAAESVSAKKPQLRKTSGEALRSEESEPGSEDPGQSSADSAFFASAPDFSGEVRDRREPEKEELPEEPVLDDDFSFAPLQPWRALADEKEEEEISDGDTVFTQAAGRDMSPWETDEEEEEIPAAPPTDAADALKKAMPVDEYIYVLPNLSSLPDVEKAAPRKPGKDYSKQLVETLDSFGVSASVINIERGPAVTRYELQPAKGVKVSKFTNLTNDISLVFAAPIRIEAPVPGKSCVGIEVPNERIESVFIKEILSSEEFRRKDCAIPIALGKDITGKTIVGDLARMPHLLVAGSTGSGKTVCMNCIIASILFRAKPTEVQMVMIDPKRVELSMYEGIPHLVDIKATPDKKIITDPKIAALVLQQMADIMDSRYDEFTRLRARNIFEYNSKASVPMPYLLIFIDELADLMMVSRGGVETQICRLTQMGRAAGMHLVIATQRPSVDVITGLIKANVPSRIAFAVTSQIDSRTILDRSGAEKLLGKGDMLYLPGDAAIARRVQGAFISSDDIESLVAFWQEQPPPDNMQLINIDPSELNKEDKKSDGENDDDEDALYGEAMEIILRERYASVSILQRKLKIGYARAGRIIDQMERKGVVGPANGSKARKILVGAMAGDHYLKNQE